MTFQNSILAGLTLIREAIQSQNYAVGTEGWKIASDGTAEFSDLTIRSSDGSDSTVTVANGTITIQDGSGNVVVEIDSDGYRLYRPDGELVAEITLDAGGSLGGFYSRNFAFPENTYSFLAGGQVVLGPVDNAVADLHGFLQYVMAPSVAQPYAVQTLSTGALDMGLDDEARLQLVSQRGERPVAWVDGGSGAMQADLRVTGNAYARNLQSGKALVNFTSLSSHTMSVNFPVPYPPGVIPVVTTNITSGGGNTARWGSRAISVSSTGFTVFVFKGDAADAAQTWSDVQVGWWAHA